MFKMATYRMTAQGLSDFLPYAHFVDANTILNKDGSFSAILSYIGEDLDSSADSEKNTLKMHLNNSLMKFGSGWMFNFDFNNIYKNSYPVESDCDFPEPTSYVVDQERRTRYKQQSLHFQKLNYITFTYLPPNDAEAKFGDLMVDGKGKDIANYSHHLSRFNHLIERFVIEMGGKLQFKRLNTHEMFSFIAWCITGEFHQLKVFDPRVDLDYLFGELADLTTTLKMKVNNKLVRVLTITDFPGVTRPEILSALTKLRFEYRISTRYIILDTEDGDKLLRKRVKTWFGKRTTAKQLITQSIGAADYTSSEESIGNIDAEVYASDAKNAVRENVLGEVKYGFYTTTILIHDENSDSIEEKVKLVLKTLNDSFFVAKDETINNVFAYLGSIPGNSWANIRMPILSTKSLCDLVSLNSTWTGLDINPNPLLKDRGINNPPLLQCVTSGAQPFRHSLHVDEFGNSLVVGPSGGLHVYLNLVALQALKYKYAKVYFFDRQKKSLPACLGVGGQFYDIGDSKNDVYFQPLRDLETIQQRQLAKTFIKLLCEIKIAGFTNLSVDQEKAIDVCLDIMSSKDETHRTLSFFVTLMMPKDEAIARAVQYYTITGPFGLLFDSNNVPADFINTHMASFELDYLNNQYGPEAMIPLVVYIFNKLKIDTFYKKHPIYIVIYECWKELALDKFAHYLEDILRTGPANNVSLILATSNPTDIMDSKLRTLILNQCRTKIFLPNPEVMNSLNYPIYQTFGLTDKQMTVIANAVGKNSFIIHRPMVSAYLNLIFVIIHIVLLMLMNLY